MTWKSMGMINQQENAMNRVWRDFSHEEKMLLKSSFQKAKNIEFGSVLILGLLHEKHDVFKTLLKPYREGVVLLTVQDLRREYPATAKIGDSITLFFDQLISGICNETMKPNEIIKKLRVNGAKHNRMRVNFAADNWLSVKRVILNVVLTANNKHISKSTSNLSLIRKMMGVKSDNKLRVVWQQFAEIVVKNMKSGFLDAASYGPEYVEQEDTDYSPLSASDITVCSTDVYL